MTYDPASGRCAGRSQPGALALMGWTLDEYGSAGAFNLGIYNCRNIRGGTIKSVHADGRAGDTGLRQTDRRIANPAGKDLARRLVAADRLGIQVVIFDRRIWTSLRPTWRTHCPHPGALGPHEGCSGPHLDHVHWELTWAAARSLTRPQIDSVLGTTTTPQPSTTPEVDVPQPNDIVASVAGPHGKGRLYLQANGDIYFEDVRAFGDYPDLRPELRRGERYFVDIWVDGSDYVILGNDRATYTFGPDHREQLTESARKALKL